MVGNCVSLCLQVEATSRSNISASQSIGRFLQDVKKMYFVEHVPVFLKKYSYRAKNKDFTSKYTCKPKKVFYFGARASIP
jgi:hypothetical protein